MVVAAVDEGDPDGQAGQPLGPLEATESATDEELLDMYCLSAERVAQRVQKLMTSDGPVTSCD